MPFPFANALITCGNEDNLQHDLVISGYAIVLKYFSFKWAPRTLKSLIDVQIEQIVRALVPYSMVTQRERLIYLLMY